MKYSHYMEVTGQNEIHRSLRGQKCEYDQELNTAIMFLKEDLYQADRQVEWVEVNMDEINSALGGPGQRKGKTMRSQSNLELIQILIEQDFLEVLPIGNRLFG